MATPAIKLTYFDGTGRAELTRLILAFGNVEFIDERIPHAEFQARKASLPLGQLPTLQVNGQTYAQSMAIARYAAKRSGLYPSDALDALRADMISETLTDTTNAFITAMFGEMDAAVKAEKIQRFAQDVVPKALGVLETMVRGEFFAGDDTPSYADLHLFDFVENGLKPRLSDFSTAAFPKLEAVLKHVRANTGVAAHLAKRQP